MENVSHSQMPDPTDVRADTQGQELDDVAREDPLGLKVLDAVEIGGTWTVATGQGGPVEPPAAEPGPEPRPRPNRQPWWAAAFGVVLLLVMATVLIQALWAQPRPGHQQAPAAIEPSAPSGAESTEAPGAGPSMHPAGLPSPHAGIPSSAPAPTGGPAPTPTDPVEPTPTPAISPWPTAIPVSPVANPP